MTAIHEISFVVSKAARQIVINFMFDLIGGLYLSVASPPVTAICFLLLFNGPRTIAIAKNCYFGLGFAFVKWIQRYPHASFARTFYIHSLYIYLNYCNIIAKYTILLSIEQLGKRSTARDAEDARQTTASRPWDSRRIPIDCNGYYFALVANTVV